MKARTLLLLLLLLLVMVGVGVAQGQVPFPISSLPPAGPYPGLSIKVSDGANATDCSVGHGAFDVKCTSTGGVWVGSSTGGGGGTSVSQNSGAAEGSLPITGFMPQACNDTSGSGTAQSCTTANSFTPQAGNCLVYTTTTANSGTGLTVNINSFGAKSIAISGASGWTTTLVASSSIPAGKPMNLCYDGTNWDASGTGYAPTGGGGGGDFVKISQTVVSSPTTTISLSVPTGYTSIKAVFTTVENNASEQPFRCIFNADTGSNYDFTLFATSDANTSAHTYNGQNNLYAGNSAGTNGAHREATTTIDVQNYLDPTLYRSYQGFSSYWNDSLGQYRQETINGAWKNIVDPITSLSCTLDSGASFTAPSTVTLYGIK